MIFSAHFGFDWKKKKSRGKNWLFISSYIKNSDIIDFYLDKI